VSDAAASDDSGGEPVAAAADAFDLSSAVKHVHSRFNPSTGSRGQIDPRLYKLFNIENMV